MQVKKAITHLAIVLAFAQCAWAEEVITGTGFTTGTSFENLPAGELAAYKDDRGEDSGSNYWESAVVSQQITIPGAVVTAYSGGAYSYKDKGTVRNALFKDVNRKYLALDLEATLDRRIMPSNVETNILLRRLPDGIYADTLVQLTPCVSAPAVDGTDKIVVWLREGDCGDGTETNLVVTAGRFAGGLDKVERCDYVVRDPAVKAGAWCRLTIRTIADITGTQNTSGKKAAAFTVYIDGKPAYADADYDIGTACRTDWLLPEARVLISERRLFPCLAPAGHSGSVEISRFSFDGQGAIDDIAVSTERPGHVISDNIFTLKWDAGVKSMTCIVSNAAAVVTNEIDATEQPRFRDFDLGTKTNAQVTVTNVVYDTAHEYLPGLWCAENDCTVTNNVFVYDGANANPVGYVVSTRDVISVGKGEGCAATFAEAKALAKKRGIRTIELQSDTVVTSGSQNGSTYNDSGSFSVKADEDVILDLCGHTLQGQYNQPTVTHIGGKLCITDSSEGKTGRILSSSDSSAGNVAVKSVSSARSRPDLTIEAGWYDGYVVITNNRAGIELGTCAIFGGNFTNAYNETDHFYLDKFVANPTLYFGLAGEYWTPATNGFVWCGLGGDARWDNPANWKGNAVPQAGDLAIFPRIAGGKGRWEVDFGEGVATKQLWIDADIFMTGTNEFADVTVVSGAGRIVGTGTAKFTGRLPGVLTEDAAGAEIRLGEEWKGTVRISGITKAEPLTNITGWGNAESKVEFAGVRGYISDRSNHALPFGLILTDDGATPAWRNDTGYTGSVVSFPTLEGSGTFLSPRNTREILQVFQFKDVAAFTGRFDIGGKRLLLGTGAVARQSAAGHYTFSDAVTVRSGLGWQGVSAHFGAQLGVYGAFDDTLMTFTGAAPDVSGVVVSLTDAQGGQATGHLQIDGNAVVIVANDLLKVGGKSVSAMEVASVVKDGSVIEVPAGSALTIVGNDVIVNGKIVSTVADYYNVKPVSGAAASYSVSFDEKAAAPSLANFTVGSSGGCAVIQVENAKPGLWYGLQTISSLAEDWETQGTEWKRASGDTVTFTPSVGDASGFFRVIMTDKNPNGGEE